MKEDRQRFAAPSADLIFCRPESRDRSVGFSCCCFFACYMTALSWADLTYVLPATSVGYVVLTLIAKFVLHEHVTLTRWLGILLISAGVGFVTRAARL